MNYADEQLGYLVHVTRDLTIVGGSLFSGETKLLDEAAFFTSMLHL